MNSKLTIGIIAGILTSISSIPQIVNVIKTKKVDEISPLMFLVWATGNGAWVWYGLMLKAPPIIITNSFSFTLAITMLILKWKYSKEGNK